MENVNQLIGSAFTGLELQDPANSERVATLLDEFGLRWTVSKQPMFLQGDVPTQFYAVVRDDNKQVFQTCKETYTAFQNSELAELLIMIADKGGYKIHGGGMFNGGGKVYVQLVSGNEINEIGENRSRVIGYTTGLNSHDGSISLRWGSSNITVCCQNTFYAASRQLSNAARHTTKMKDKVDMYLREIGVAMMQEQSIFDKFIELAQVPLRQANIKQVVKDITTVDIMLTDSEARDKFGSYNVNRSNELLSSISREVSQKGSTLWGLFSGVTNYTTHVMGAPKRENGKLESKFVGAANRIDNDIFSMVSGMMN